MIEGVKSGQNQAAQADFAAVIVALTIVQSVADGRGQCCTYCTRMSDSDLGKCGGRVASDRDLGREAYVHFNIESDVHAIRDAKRLRGTLGYRN